jgi:hypothetical protein
MTFLEARKKVLKALDVAVDVFSNRITLST